MKNAECRMIVVFLLVCLLLCGCAGVGDWSAPLVEDYAIWRLNGYEIVLVEEHSGGSGGQIVIGTYLYRVTWNEAYICAQKTDPPEERKGLPIVPEVDYYILRVSDGEVFGPYTAAEYQSKCKELEITDLPEWVYVQDLRP